MGDRQTDIYKEHQQYWHKYIYYLLTVNGAAIVYSLNKLEGKVFEKPLIALLLAIGCWIISFFCGIKVLKHSLRNLAMNFTIAKIEEGVHAKAGNNIVLQQSLKEAYQNIDEKGSHKVRTGLKTQLLFLLLGTLFYTAWQLIEMYIRTINQPK